jgi:hypothetical protein
MAFGSPIYERLGVWVQQRLRNKLPGAPRRSELAFFTFDDAGQITSAVILGREARGVDIQPGVWHTIAVLTPDVVCFQVKPGPYSAASDKDFVLWAPREGDARAGAIFRPGSDRRCSKKVND